MKLYAPKYYQRFRCIAERCRHSCCVGWEIDIDEQTLACYDRSDAPYATHIRTSIDRQGDTPHFRLTEGERCPHLDGRGLCRIILNCGEGYLCDICREHPRFYHGTARGLEVGLGMACEEAARIILSSDSYAEWVEIDTPDGNSEWSEFDVIAERESSFALLSDRNVPYMERLRALSERYGASPAQYTDAQWRRALNALEYLDDGHRDLFGCYSSNETTSGKWEAVLERALAYFLYRHASQTEQADELRAAVGFSLFCERLLASMIRTTGAQQLSEVVELARILSEELEYSEENTEDILNMFGV